MDIKRTITYTIELAEGELDGLAALVSQPENDVLSDELQRTRRDFIEAAEAIRFEQQREQESQLSRALGGRPPRKGMATPVPAR